MSKIVYINIDWLCVLLALTNWGYYLMFYVIPFSFIMNKGSDKNKSRKNIVSGILQSVNISFLIPCHNEELVIYNTLMNLTKLNYDFNMI